MSDKFVEGHLFRNCTFCEPQNRSDMERETETQSREVGEVAVSPAPPTPAVNTRACSACNRRKTKCDRTRPTCSCCRRSQSSCEYPTKRKQLQRNSSNHRKLENVVQDISRLIEMLDQTPPAAAAAAAIADDADKENELTRAFASPSIILENASSTGGSGIPDVQLLSPTEYMPDVFVDLPSSTLELSVASLQLPSDDFACLDADLDAALEGLTKFQASIFIEYASALQLVDIFFDHVQPWMPILHRPRFTKTCKEQFTHGDHALSALDSDSAFLLCSIFALAVRFAPPALTGGQSFVGKDGYFALQAQRLHFELQARGIYSLETLQGSVMLSYFSLTSGEFASAWIRTGFCVRLAQELGVCEIDADPARRWRQNMDWVQMEERRRAWWLIWDLDTVLSTMSGRPFAVDRRLNPVLLPVTDEFWFAEVEAASVRIASENEDPWKSLEGCGNKSSYAWYLVSRLLVSLGHDAVLSGDTSLHDERTFTNEKMYLQLLISLPSDLFSVKERSVAESNWATFAHLVLACAFATPSTRPHTAFNNNNNNNNTNKNDMVALKDELKVRILEILTRWPMHHAASASPLAACTLMPLCVPPEQQSSISSFDRLTQNILSPIMCQFARRCSLGSLRLSDSGSSWPVWAPARCHDDHDSTVHAW